MNRIAARNWVGGVKRMLQGAVVVAVASTLPATWAAGGSGAGAAGPGGGATQIQIGSVAAGGASLSQQGSINTIRTSGRSTIINFQRLTLGAGDTLNFVQPTANSRVLGRIMQAAPTRIDGTLLSNGRVYLVNPAGVIFGEHSVVNVGQIYAAAGHMADNDFLSGRNRFTDNTGAVQNFGTIQANQVHLVGQSVSNAGRIDASGGGAGALVTLTAGKDVYLGETISPTGETSVLVKVSTSNTATPQAGTGVSNTGTVDAGAGQLHIGAGDLYAAGIYNGGALRGRRITLDAHQNSAVTTGTIDASNESGAGGSVQILGEKVGVFAGTVDASGSTGGSIRIGGDFHGGPGLPAADTTVIGATAQIRADGGATGDGGTIAVWSNGTTRFDGAISARGGAASGDGGFVEVSGKNNFEFLGSVDLAAPHGALGTLLLDPIDLTINHGSSTVTLSPTIGFTDNSGGNLTILDGQLNALTGNIILQATQNITFASNANVTLTHAGQSITVQAGNDLTLSGSGGNGASITTAGGAIVLSAGDTHTSGTGASVAGSLTLGSSALVKTTGSSAAGGDITLMGNNLSITTGGNGADILAGTGAVNFFTNNGTQTINIGGSGGYDLTTAEIGRIGSAGTIVIGDPATQSGPIVWASGATLSYNFSQPTAVQLNTSGSIGLASAFTPGSGSAGMNLAVNAGGDVAISGVLNTAGGNATITGMNITLAGNTAGQVGKILSGGGDVAVHAGGSITLTGSSTLALASGVTSLGGAILLSAGDATVAGNSTGGSLALGQNVALDTVTGSGGTTGANITLQGSDVDITAGATLKGGSAGQVRFFTNVPTEPISVAAGATAGTYSVSPTELGAAATSGNIVNIVIGQQGVQTGDLGWDTAFSYHPSGTLNLTLATAGNLGINAAISPNTVATDVLKLRLHGGAVTIAAGVDVGSGSFSSGGTTFTLNSGLVTTAAGATITIAHTGAVTLNSPIDAGTGSISVTGDGITTAAALSGGAIHLDGLAGDIAVGGAVTASGAFSSSGGNFSNTQPITAAGISIDQAGTVSIGNTLNAGTGALAITGAAITLSADISGGSVSLDSAGAVVLNNTVTASSFASTGSTFTLATTATIDTSAAGGSVTLDQTGAVSLGGTITAGAGTVDITGDGLTQSAGTLTGGALVLRGTGDFSLTWVRVNDLSAGIGGSLGLSNGANLHLVAATGLAGVSADGGIAIGVGGTIDVDAPASAGTNILRLTASGDINGTGLLGGSQVRLSSATQIGNINAPHLAMDSTYFLSAGGSGNIAVEFVPHGTASSLNASQILTLSPAGGAATLTVDGDMIVDRALGTGLTTLTIHATGAIQGDGNLAHDLAPQILNLTAAGLGTTTELVLDPGISAALTTSGAGALGDIRFTTSTALTAFTFATAPSSQSITIDSAGDLIINASLALSAGDSLVLHAGTGGVGNLFLVGPLTLSADGITLWAGAGSSSTSQVVALGAVTLVDATGIGQLPSLVIEQDAALLNSPLTVVNFAAALPLDYELRSDGGDVTITSTADLGNHLQLLAPGHTVAIATPLLLTSLTASAATIRLGADVTTVLDQSYTAPGGVLLANNVSLGGRAITFDAPVLSDPTHWVLSTNASAAVTFNQDIGGLAGGNQELGGLFINNGGGSLVLGKDPFSIRTALGAGGGTVSIGVPVTLGGDTTIAAAGNVTFSSTIGGTGHRFSSSGAAFIAQGAITAADVTLTHSSTQLNAPVNAGGGTITIGGGAIQTGALGTLTADTVSLDSGTLAASLLGDVSATGSFGSVGGSFSSGGTIAASNITIQAAAGATSTGTLNATAGPLVVGGSTVSLSGPIGGTSITLGGSSVTVSGSVNSGAGGLNSTGGTFAFTGSYLGGPVTVHHTGAVAINGPMDAGAAAIDISGAGVSTTGTLAGGGITLDGLSQDVTVGGGVSASGAFGSSGANFSNTAAITAAGVTLTHAGTVTVGAALNSPGQPVSIQGTVLAINAPVTGSAVSLVDSGGTSISGAVSGAFASTGSGFLLTGSISGATVTIDHPGAAVTLDGTLVGGDVVVIGSGIGSNSAGVITGGAVALDAQSGALSLGGAITASGSFASTGAAFTNTAIVTAQGVTLHQSGAIIIGAALVSPAGAVSITGSSLTINAPITSTSVALVDTAGTAVNAAITASGGFAATGAAFTTTAAITAGTITLDRTLGATLSGSMDAGLVDITATTLTQSTGTLHATSLVLRNGGGAGNFVLATADVGSLAASLGGSLNLTNAGALTVASVGGINGITANGLTLAAGGTLSVQAPVASLTNAITLSGQGIASGAGGTIAGTNVSLDAGSQDLALSRSITATGDLLLASTSAGGLVVSGSPTFSAGGNITAPHQISGGAGGGDLTLHTGGGTSSLISVALIGAGPSQRFGDITFESSGQVQLGGAIYADTIVFRSSDPTGILPSVPRGATIYADAAALPNNTLILDAAGSFYMEQNQKLSVFDSSIAPGASSPVATSHGNLEILSGSITLSDISVLGRLVVGRIAPAKVSANNPNDLTSADLLAGTPIGLQNREPGPVSGLQPLALTTGGLDSGMDIVAGIAIAMRGELSLHNGLAINPHVFLSSPAAKSDLNNWVTVTGAVPPGKPAVSLAPFSITLPADYTLIKESQIFDGVKGFDLVAMGAPVGVFPSLNFVQLDQGLLSPERSQAISGALQEALKDIGIYARDVEMDEVLQFLLGGALYNDAPGKLKPAATEYRVAVNRLPYSPVVPIVDAYRKLFGARDDKGNLVYDQNGKMKVRNEEIKNALLDAWLNYLQDKQDAAVPAGFRGYLQAHKDDAKDTVALDYLNQLRDLLQQIQGLGLTAKEIDLSRTELLGRVRPSEIGEKEFLDVINGPAVPGQITASR